MQLDSSKPIATNIIPLSCPFKCVASIVITGRMNLKSSMHGHNTINEYIKCPFKDVFVTITVPELVYRSPLSHDGREFQDNS